MKMESFSYLTPPFRSALKGLELSTKDTFANFHINSKATIKGSICDLNNWLLFNLFMKTSSAILLELSSFQQIL